MLVLVTLSIVGVSAAVGLQSVSRGPGMIETRLWIPQQITSKIESLRDTPYASLASGSATSDPDINNNTYTISWTVTEIDPANPTASPVAAKANSGLKQLAVTLNGMTISTWITQ